MRKWTTASSSRPSQDRESEVRAPLVGVAAQNVLVGFPGSGRIAARVLGVAEARERLEGIGCVVQDARELGQGAVGISARQEGAAALHPRVGVVRGLCERFVERRHGLRPLGALHVQSAQRFVRDGVVGADPDRVVEVGLRLIEPLAVAQ